MAINMSNVKKIMHGNKQVSKIEDSNGNIIWQKAPEYTYTIYDDENHFIKFSEGTANKTYATSNSIFTGLNWSNKYRVEGLCFYSKKQDNNQWRRLLGCGYKNDGVSWNDSFQICSSSTYYTLNYVIQGTQNNATIKGLYNGSVRSLTSNEVKLYISIGNRGNGKFNIWNKYHTSAGDTYDWTEILNMSTFPTEGKPLYFGGAYEYSGNKCFQLGRMYVYTSNNTSTWPSTLVQKLCPAKRSDNVIGYYDKQNNEFYPANINNGTVSIVEVGNTWTI